MGEIIVNHYFRNLSFYCSISFVNEYLQVQSKGLALLESSTVINTNSEVNGDLISCSGSLQRFEPESSRRRLVCYCDELKELNRRSFLSVFCNTMLLYLMFCNILSSFFYNSSVFLYMIILSYWRSNLEGRNWCQHNYNLNKWNHKSTIADF